MAFQAKRSNILQVTFTAALDNRHDVVGIPKTLSDPLARTEPPIGQRFQAGCAAQSFQMSQGFEAVDQALGTDASIALEHFLADVAGIGSEPPFLHTPVRTKRLAAWRHFEVAPATKTPAVSAFGQAAPISPAARHGARSAHLTDYAIPLEGLVNRTVLEVLFSSLFRSWEGTRVHW